VNQEKHKQQNGLVGVEEIARFDTLIDVRTPAEFAHDHIPGAVNCPVLTDEEHAQVGTLYKQVSPFEARKVGAALVARNIASYIETRFAGKDKGWMPLIYCWRGGQRSESMRVIFRQIGWKACKLEGGYKVWRHHVIDTLETLPARFQFKVITGLTGSGKSYLLDALAAKGEQVLHLEQIACHKGSVLGGNPEIQQPTQPAFETELFRLLSGFDPARPVYSESENRKIGKVHLPESMAQALANGECIELQVPVAVRVEFLTRDYAWVETNREWLHRQLQRIASMHPKTRTAQWTSWIEKGNFIALVNDLLIHHYDPLYARSHGRHLNSYDQAWQIDLPDLEPDTLYQVADRVIERQHATRKA
jgi:tRNA 2-selenouridine synthase